MLVAQNDPGHPDPDSCRDQDLSFEHVNYILDSDPPAGGQSDTILLFFKGLYKLVWKIASEQLPANQRDLHEVIDKESSKN